MFVVAVVVAAVEGLKDAEGNFPSVVRQQRVVEGFQVAASVVEDWNFASWVCLDVEQVLEVVNHQSTVPSAAAAVLNSAFGWKQLGGLT